MTESSEMPSFAIVIVVYNKLPSDISFIRDFIKVRLISQIIVCDNSDRPSEEKWVEGLPQNCKYLSMHGNQGLASAYAAAQDLIKSEYVCLLDDDTTLPLDYFDSVLSCIHDEVADVYVPIVWAGKMLMSPCNKDLFLFHPARNVEKIHKRFSAINSGMIIRSALFKSYNYRTGLFLDMVDHKFISDIKSANHSIRIMTGVQIEQEYSRLSYDKHSEVKRYSIYKKDARLYYSTSMLAKFVCELHLLYRRMNLAIKYKDISLLSL